MSEKAKQEALTRAKEAEKRKKSIVCRGCGMKGHIQAKCRTNRVHLTQDGAGWVVMTTVLHEDKDGFSTPVHPFHAWDRVIVIEWWSSSEVRARESPHLVELSVGRMRSLIRRSVLSEVFSLSRAGLVC